MQVKTGTTVNIRVLTPLVKATIEAQGEGHKLKGQGGTLQCCHSWVYRILRRLKLSYRKATTAAAKLPEDWKEQIKMTALRCVHCLLPPLMPVQYGTTSQLSFKLRRP